MQHDLEHHYAVKTSHSSIENDLGSPDRKGQREELAAFCTGRSWTIPDNADSFGMYTIYKDRDELSTYQVFIYDKQSHFIKSVIYTVL